MHMCNHLKMLDILDRGRYAEGLRMHLTVYTRGPRRRSI